MKIFHGINNSKLKELALDKEKMRLKDIISELKFDSQSFTSIRNKKESHFGKYGSTGKLEPLEQDKEDENEPYQIYGNR